MATVVSQVGQGHYFFDYGGRIFKHSAEQLSDVTERKRLAREAVHESQDRGRDTDRVFLGSPNCLNSHSRLQNMNQMPHLCLNSPMFRCLTQISQKHRDDPGDDNDREEQPSTEPVPHSSSSHWERRPEFEVPPPEPGDPVATRRRIIAKRTLTAVEEEESRQKRMKLEQVPELFPLTGKSCLRMCLNP